VEQEIAVPELRGSSFESHYFSVMDRAPKPGEYKYMPQGIVRLGQVLTTFTLFRNEAPESLVAEALAMLKGAAPHQAE